MKNEREHADYFISLSGKELTEGRNAAVFTLMPVCESKKDTDFVAYIIGFLAATLTAIQVGVVPETEQATKWLDANDSDLAKRIIQEAEELSEEMVAEEFARRAGKSK